MFVYIVLIGLKSYGLFLFIELSAQLFVFLISLCDFVDGLGVQLTDTVLKCSQKRQLYSRAYINFKKPEDVLEFAESFDGHVFVNEKGNAKMTLYYILGISFTFLVLIFSAKLMRKNIFVEGIKHLQLFGLLGMTFCFLKK